MLCVSQKGFFSEKSEISLNEFIDNVEYKENISLPEGDIGKQIWEFIKEKTRKRLGCELSSCGMTDFEKKNILKVLDTILEFVEKIEKTTEEIDKDEAFALIQEGVIAVGEKIESLIGEGHKSVSILEELCEEIYQGNVFRFRSLIIKAQDEINVIGKKLDVLYLPYKFSMWDSLESIWEASRDDDQSVSTIVPIPYVDRNSKGEADTILYEIEDFKAVVPVLDRMEIDIKERCPDIIFIHNPYDGMNFVTSVFPEYYSENIKDYTKTLVYIPYNVFEREIVSDRYAYTPGVFYSDYVILQSENVKEKIRDSFVKYLKDNKLSSMLEGAKDKFHGIGSPKTDRLFRELNTQRKIPKAWEEKILVDGKRKKIIFMNTHLNYLMEGRSTVFAQKMWSIIEEVDKRNDVVFLWRPHPLSIHSIKAMNPGFMDEYLCILEAFQNTSWGILDSEDDAYVAMCISDAYYGALGSLGELYTYTKRPILMIDC